MNLFLFLAIILSFTLFFGRIIEKIRVPWVFAALFLGLLLSLKNPFVEITSSSTFSFLSDIGMYFLLFIIGLELNVKEMCKEGQFISKLSLSLVLTESLLGALFIHYFFKIPWGISILTASSFSTVGEAILIPILDEFGIIKTKFGQTLLGVGTLDDIVELITIIAASIVLGTSVEHSHTSFSNNLILLGVLFFIPLFLQIFHSQVHHLKFKKVPQLFLFGVIILFLFVGIGSFVEASALGAILAGIVLKNLFSEERIAKIESIIRVVAYGLFVPIFFIYVGTEIDMNYLFSAPLLVVSILFITNSTKILTSYIIAKPKLGTKKSILLGIGLSAKFSTSIVILTMLYEKNIIPLELYSVLIGAMIVSKFIIPIAFSVLLKKWDLKFERV
jgi:Ca2+-transporting ATPase